MQNQKPTISLGKEASHFLEVLHQKSDFFFEKIVGFCCSSYVGLNISPDPQDVLKFVSNWCGLGGNAPSYSFKWTYICVKYICFQIYMTYFFELAGADWVATLPAIH